MHPHYRDLTPSRDPRKDRAKGCLSCSVPGSDRWAWGEKAAPVPRPASLIPAPPIPAPLLLLLAQGKGKEEESGSKVQNYLFWQQGVISNSVSLPHRTMSPSREREAAREGEPGLGPRVGSCHDLLPLGTQRRAALGKAGGINQMHKTMLASPP